MWDTAGEVRRNSQVMYSYGQLHIDEQRLEPTFPKRISAMWNAISQVEDLKLVTLVSISCDDNHYTTECPRGVMVKAMNCGIVVREFVLQSRYYVHFRANTLGKRYEPPYSPSSYG